MIDPSAINLYQFLCSWYGEPDKPVEPIANHPQLPPPLLAWHTLAAQWSRPLLTVKKFLPLDRISLHDDIAVFMTDPADTIWGFDPSAPMDVYEGKLHEGWRKVPENFTEFLIHNALGEAAYNAPHTTACDSMPNQRMSDVLAPLTQVAFGEWNWPASGHQIFMSETVIAHVCPALKDGAPLSSPAGCSEVQVGSIEPTSISYLHEMPGVEWF